MPLFFWPQFPEICAGTTLCTDGNFSVGSSIDEKGKAAARIRRQDLLKGLGFSALHSFKQTHSALVRPACGDSFEEADALCTQRQGELLAVHTADCIPVFFYAPQQKAIALAHSGRKGLKKGINEEVLAALQRLYGSLPHQIYVHIGPHISAAAYEVGAEIFEEFGLPCLQEKAFLDMQGILFQRLQKAGIDSNKITTSGLCTLNSLDKEGNPLFFSYRRKDKGQILSFLGLRPQ